MKSKLNRKLLKQSYPPQTNFSIDAPQITKFKFQISRDSISCFIGKSKTSKRVYRKNSQSSAKSQKQPSKSKKSLPKKQPASRHLEKGARKKQSSPDIIRQSLNTILSKIQQNGILCSWNEQQDHLQYLDDPIQNIDSVSIWTTFQNQTEKSFASTNDFPHYHTMNLPWNSQNDHQHYVNPLPLSFDVIPQLIEHDWRTTIMIRNIPNKYSVNQLAEEIDTEHENTYDFLYLPCDPKNQCNVGYGFINFVHTRYLSTFYKKYNKYVWQKYKSEKICALTYARLQGLNQLIEHFQNSKVLNQKQKKYRPIIKMDKIQKIVMEQQSR